MDSLSPFLITMNTPSPHQQTRISKLLALPFAASAFFLPLAHMQAFTGDYVILSDTKPAGFYNYNSATPLTDQFGQWTVETFLPSSGSGSGSVNTLSAPDSITVGTFISLSGEMQQASTTIRLTHTATQDVTVMFDVALTTSTLDNGAVFWNEPGSYGAFPRFMVQINGELPPEFDAPSSGIYEGLSFDLKEGDELTLLVGISQASSGSIDSYADATISNFTVIPEPVSACLVAISMMGFAMRRRR